MSCLAEELAGIDLGDRRLNRRAGQLIETLGGHPTLSIPAACGGWDETRAAYCLFDHAAITAEAVLAPHIACTEQRLRARARVLCIEDTTELDDTKRKASMTGLGVLNYETRWGIYLHPTLAVTPDGVSLGVLACHSYIREPGSLGQEKAANRPLEEKESVRWVDGFARVNELAETLTETRLTYIADREGDIYDLFVEAPCPEHGADWLVRGQHHERLLSDGRKLIEALEEAPVLTEISFERPAAKGRPARYHPGMDSILISWLGRTDLRAVSESRQLGVGPVAQALATGRFERLELLCDCSAEETESYLAWLGPQTNTRIVPHRVVLPSPTDFDAIYRHARTVAAQAAADVNGQTDHLTYHLSPGTPSMAAVWIILAKTRFPAALIESSIQHGVSTVAVPFQISADFIPDLLRRPDAELTRLTTGLPPAAPDFEAIIHQSPAMQRVVARAQRVALRSIPVLIEDESGTGKELLARAIQ